MAVRRPHILAIPLPAVGHINPMLHLCGRLERAGFEVTMLVPDSVNLSTFAMEANKTRTNIVALPDGLPEDVRGKSPATVMDAINRLMDSVEGMKPAAEEFIRSFIFDQSKRVSCIISDAFVPWPHKMTSLLNAPVAVFSTHAATTDLVLIHGRMLKEQGYLPAKTRRTGDQMINFIPGVSASHPNEILPLSLGDDSPWLTHVIESFENILGAKWILSSSFQAMEDEVVQMFQEHLGVRHYLTVGPLIAEGQLKEQGNSDSEASSCMEWLDAQDNSSVIYISHGSLAILSSEQLMELAHGLEASEHRFILVTRPSLVVDYSESFEQEFASFQERIKPRGRVVPWAPQSGVLNHPAVAAFLTHCGWNSTMEAIAAGVPMITWPCLAEQNINCKLIEERGLGFRIHTSVGRHEDPQLVHREHIVKTISSIMGDTGRKLKVKVKQLSDELKKGLAPGGTSYSNFESFCRDISNVNQP